MNNKILASFSLFALSMSPAIANELSPKANKDDKKIEAPKVATSFGEKEQKEVQALLNELSRQHNNATSLTKEVREPISLATQSALVAKNSGKLQEEDSLKQLTGVATSALSRFKQTGIASWYGRQFHGKKTASGERFDMNAMTAAHRSLPFGCYVKVTNKDNGQSVIVKINDRGPFHGNRVLDLSYGAAKAIGITKKGMGNVTIERIDDPKNAQIALNNQ